MTQVTEDARPRQSVHRWTHRTPAGATETARSFQGEGQHHMQLGVTLQQCLGPEDVGPAGQGPVGGPDGPVVEDAAHGGDHRFLLLGDEPTPSPLSRHPVPAEVGHRRPGQLRQDRRIGTGEPADQAQLAPRRRQRTEVAVVLFRGPLQRPDGGPCIPHHQVGLGLRGCRVVTHLPGCGNQFERLCRQLRGARRVTSEKGEGGGVDGGVVTAGGYPYSPVVLGRGQGELAALVVVGGSQCLVLVDAGPQRGDVLGPDRPEVEHLELAGGLNRRTGAGQGEHRPVAEGRIAGMLVEPAGCQVEAGQQLAAALGIEDPGQPRLRAPPRRIGCGSFGRV